MVKHTWSNHHEAYERIGGWAINAFGERELVYISRMWWAYFEWMKGREFDVDNFTAECDAARGDYSFSDALQAWAYYLSEDRKSVDLPHPEWLIL